MSQTSMFRIIAVNFDNWVPTYYLLSILVGIQHTLQYNNKDTLYIIIISTAKYEIMLWSYVSMKRFIYVITDFIYCKCKLCNRIPCQWLCWIMFERFFFCFERFYFIVVERFFFVFWKVLFYALYAQVYQKEY